MRYAALLLFVLLAACDAASPATPSPVPPLPPVPTVPGSVTWDGTGSADTLAQPLAGGAYSVAWGVTTDSGDCAAAGTLRSVADPHDSHPLFTTRAPNAVPQHSAVYGLAAGAYYLQMQTSCATWRVTLTPQP